MRRLAAIAGAGAVCLLLALLLGQGPAPLGRIVLGAGLPRLATAFFDDPGWQGIAQYRAGAPEEAAQSFLQARAYLNLGNAHVQAGRYAAALEAYDIAQLQGDQAAAANFDLVAAFYAGLALDPEAPIAWSAKRERNPEDEAVKAPVAQGSARASGTGDDVTNVGSLLGLPQLETFGIRPVRKVFDEKYMVANRRWLATLSDVPGEYLAARIREEHKRRFKLGLSPPAPEDPR